MKISKLSLLVFLTCISIPALAYNAYCCRNNNSCGHGHGKFGYYYDYPQGDINEACVSFCVDYEHSLQECMEACRA